MCLIDVRKWISEKTHCVVNIKDFYYTQPPLRVYTDTEFFFIPTGMTDKIINERPQGYGAIKGDSLTFLSFQKEKMGVYDDEHPLMFCRVPNSINRGVFGLCYSDAEQFLVTSGGLSGCTACSMFLPDSNKFYLFHVGKSVVCEMEYTQQMKNADLYRSVLICLGMQNDLRISIGIDDEVLFAKLSDICSKYEEKIIINIYVSDASAANARSKLVGDEKIQRKGKGYSLTLRYYENKGNFFASKYDRLYSVHSMKANDRVEYSSHKRDNYKFII